MDEATRRKFLIMAGVGAATTAGVAVAASTGLGTEPAAGEAAATLPASASGSLVAWVEDVRAGRMSVMVGETEVVVRDPDLVARLSRAATGRAV
jgi:hypothetical protein